MSVGKGTYFATEEPRRAVTLDDLCQHVSECPSGMRGRTMLAHPSSLTVGASSNCLPQKHLRHRRRVLLLQKTWMFQWVQPILTYPPMRQCLK